MLSSFRRSRGAPRELAEQLGGSGFECSFGRSATRLDRRIDLVELQ